MVDGAVAGEDGAAEEGRVGEGDAVGDGEHTGGGYDRLLGERGDVQAGMEVRAVGGAGVDVGGAVERVGAQPDLAERAGVATSAGRSPVEDDPVAGRDMGDPVADGHDRARALVTEDGGDGHAHGAVGQGEVGVADPGGGEPDADLAGAWVREVDVGDLQRSAHGGKYGGTDHGNAPQN